LCASFFEKKLSLGGGGWWLDGCGGESGSGWLIKIRPFCSPGAGLSNGVKKIPSGSLCTELQTVFSDNTNKKNV
jgi:hypothetical protein